MCNQVIRTFLFLGFFVLHWKELQFLHGYVNFLHWKCIYFNYGCYKPVLTHSFTFELSTNPAMGLRQGKKKFMQMLNESTLPKKNTTTKKNHSVMVWITHYSWLYFLKICIYCFILVFLLAISCLCSITNLSCFFQVPNLKVIVAWPCYPLESDLS